MRVETHLDKMQRREQALIARTELLEGRIGDERRISSNSGGGVGLAKGTAQAKGTSRAGDEGALSREALRLKQLTRKKESLAYAVESLNLQAKQRQRALRRSVAAQKEDDEF